MKYLYDKQIHDSTQLPNENTFELIFDQSLNV